MNRDEHIAEIAQRRLEAKKNVTNPKRILEFIRGDLELLTDDELASEYERLTNPKPRRDPAQPAENYKISTLDHAISDALVIIARGFDVATARLLLEDDYEPAIAGRALAMATDGAYKIDMGRSVARATDQAKWNPISLDEYRTIMGDAMPDLPVAEDIDW